jgi:outer membrane lipoprotein-sorting protein
VSQMKKTALIVALTALVVSAPTPVIGQGASGAKPARSDALHVLDRATQAMGGIDALRQVRTIVSQLKVTTSLGESEHVSYIQFPDRSRVDAHTAQGTMISGFDGTTAWARDPSGSRDVPQLTAEARQTLNREVIRLLVSAYDKEVRLRLLPSAIGSDGHTERVLELTGLDGGPITLNIDTRNWLVTKETFLATAGRVRIEETFSDFRKVDGLVMPFVMTWRGGPISITRRVTSIRINQPIDPSLFKRSGN